MFGQQLEVLNVELGVIVEEFMSKLFGVIILYAKDNLIDTKIKLVLREAQINDYGIR